MIPNPKLLLFLGLLCVVGLAYFSYSVVQINCSSKDCVGLELYTPSTRYFFYTLLFLFVATLLMTIRGILIHRQLYFDVISGNKLNQKIKTSKNDILFALVFLIIAAVLVGVHVTNVEGQISDDYKYCYGTSGEPGERVRLGSLFIHSALYVNKSTECPDRSLFMNWYDEQGREFTTFNTHPLELEFNISN